MRGDHIAAGFLYGSLDTRGWEAGIAAVRRGGASGAEKRRDVARVMRVYPGGCEGRGWDIGAVHALFGHLRCA